MAILLTALSGSWSKTFPDHAQQVCVEVGTNMHSSKRADQVLVGDKVCAFGSPNPGGGLEIETVAEV